MFYLSRRTPVLHHTLCLLICLVAAIPALAGATSRVALVIGNSAYTDTSPLPNARTDGEAMAGKLRDLDFEVFEGIDLNRGQMQSLISRYSRALRDAEVGLFFYAGHGMQVEGKNHLVPVNAVIEDDADLPFQTIPVDVILSQMERNVPTRLVFLDACRDNPLAKKLARSLGGTSRSVSVDQGLAQMQAGVGTLIAYATEPDAVALDGEGPNSPFTTALLQHLDTPGLEVRQLLTRVRQDVLSSTANQQVPWDHSSLTGEFFFVPEAQKSEPAVVEVAPAPAPVPAAAPDRSMELAFWQSAQQIQDPQARRMALEAYMNAYPEGEFVTLAKVMITTLTPASESRGVAQPEESQAAKPEIEKAPIQETKAQETKAQEPKTQEPKTQEPKAQKTKVKIAKAEEPKAEVAKVESPPVDPLAEAESREEALGLGTSQRRRIQQSLTLLGFNTYGVDGIFGSNTRKAIRGFQKSRDFQVTGFLQKADLARLEKDAAPALAKAAEQAEAARKAREAKAAERRAAQARAAEAKAKAAKAAKATQEAEQAAKAEQPKKPSAPPKTAVKRPPPPRQAKRTPPPAPPPSAAPAPPPKEKKPNYAFRRCMMNYEKSYSDCVGEHGEP